VNPRLPWNNPLAEADLAHGFDLLALGPEDTVLDVGCGHGELLARVVERHGCRGVGVDPDGAALAAARTRLAAHAARVVLHEAKVQTLDLAPASFAAALCLGSTHAFGPPGQAYDATLAALAALVRPGGRLLVGEGFWRRPPDEAYLAATGMGAGDFASHADNVARGEALGLLPLLALAASPSDWDRFESRFWRAAEEQLAASPDDEDARARADHWRAWRRAYLAWGRDTLGFGLYLFAVPGGG
jgi:SAM-dependent methyltransferase